MWNERGRWSPALAALALCAGCACAEERYPLADMRAANLRTKYNTVDYFRAAVRYGDWGAVYEILSPATKKWIDEELVGGALEFRTFVPGLRYGRFDKDAKGALAEMTIAELIHRSEIVAVYDVKPGELGRVQLLYAPVEPKMTNFPLVNAARPGAKDPRWTVGLREWMVELEGGAKVKTIVAAVDGSTMSLVALRYGAEIAVRTGASIRAVFVKDVKLLESSALAAAAGAAKGGGGAVEEAVAREAEEALGRARDRCGRLGLRVETAVRRGVVPTILVEESRGADLVTMGRWGENALWATGLLGSAVEVVARKVGKPVLVASGAYKTPKRIVAAYDGSPFAKKALALAEEVAQALALEVETLSVSKGNPAQEIAGEATPDTITFLGAYGHSPLRELVLGSTTEQVMRRAKGPVVLCR